MVCGRRSWGTESRGARCKLAAFTSGRTRYLLNAMLLTTGFDFPGIDCIVDYQSTKSVGLHVQKLGRGLRNVYARGFDLDTQDGRLAAIAAGPKPNCLILGLCWQRRTARPDRPDPRQVEARERRGRNQRRARQRVPELP
ncbi:MAG: helicase-related protein [Pararobbsia sp.]